MPAKHGNNPHRNKRLKTDLACDTCRRRKQRCDGKRPSCAHCELAGFSCSYRPNPTSAHNSLQISTDDSRLPDLHTAAGHKILQYWPRLRVKLTLGLEPFTFLKAADEEDALLKGLVLAAEQEFELLPIIWSLENFYENLFEFPLSLVDLLKTTLNLRECSIEFLLLQTVAARLMATNAVDPALPSSETCFKLALESSWKFSSKSDEYAIPLALCFAHILLYFFARPFHTLGMLQAIKPGVDRFDKRRSNDGIIERQKAVYNRLHYLLESDILPDLDGIPSTTSLQLVVVPRPSSSEYGAASDSTHEAGPVISSLYIKLDTWYQSLPLDMQFSRNISSFNLNSRLMPSRIRELALRYYACYFILHRVVLYMIVYEDMEEAATPQSTRREFEPWVLETCRSCTENAGLIILTQHANYKSGNIVPYHSWCELQLLVGAYVVVLQVQSVLALAPMFRDLGEIGGLLDAAEMVLQMCRSPL
ncbi:hypothetical protein N431DRAFT_548543 [Stipitochalara longipes BDJ]|nr:hypothetical protein N431DRAFT_548543 [Stipitochalara longipes BDJ]